MEKCLREEVYIGMLHNIVKTLSCWSNSQFVLWFTQLTIRLYVCLIICNAAFPYNIALMREEDSIYTFPVFATVFKYLLSPRWRNDAVNCRRPNLSVLNLSGLEKIKIVRSNLVGLIFYIFFFARNFEFVDWYTLYITKLSILWTDTERASISLYAVCIGQWMISWQKFWKL